MTTAQHAAQLWSVLALAARNRQVLTYEIVGRLVGLPRFGLGRHLEPIQSFCLLKKLPPLTILVVSEDSGMPGVGFIAAENIPQNQALVFGFDWLGIKAPTPEELEAAAQQQPSNGVVTPQ